MGDAFLLAAAVVTLVLFIALYAMLPPTSLDVQTAAQNAESQMTNQGK